MSRRCVFLGMAVCPSCTYQVQKIRHWEPPWLKSGNELFTVEDGQPAIVRVAVIIGLFSAFSLC